MSFPGSRPCHRHAPVLAVLLLLTAAFGTPPSVADEPLRLQLRWLHQFQYAGYYMALEKGFYRDAGLDVEILEGGPARPGPIEALLSGRADFAVSGSGAVIARMSGRPVVALAAIMQTSPLVWIVRGDADIHTPADLIGKRAMVSPAPESAELLMTLLREGIDPQHVRTQLSSYDPMALVRGETDAFNGYVTNEPWLLGREGHDYRIINPRDYGVNFYNDVLITSERLLGRKPDAVDAFTRASLLGWEYAMTHVEETVQLIHNRYAPNKHIDHLRYEAREMQRLVMPELIQLGHMNPGRWEVIAESYVALGMSPGPVRLDGFLHTPRGTPDYGLFYRFGGVALLALLIIGAIALRFAQLNQALRKEVTRREGAEEQLRSNLEESQRLASIDPLTGLWNRMHFTDAAEAEIVRSNRYHYPLALLFIDIDHFKQINDRYGHATGDFVLRRLSELVKGKLRQSDTFCRWGGEEFLILMPHTSLEQATEMAEHLRSRIVGEILLDDAPVTISVGVAGLRLGERLDDLVHAADQALYRAKFAGRNRVEIQSPAADG
ncbi:MAG: ABC transporter substrate-binding protein [Pseudomonadota bacterium]